MPPRSGGTNQLRVFCFVLSGFAGQNETTMTEGLIVFTSTHVEDRFLECLGCTRVNNARSVFINNYRVQKYHLVGAVYNETVIRSGNVLERAARLRDRLGGGPVYIVDCPGSAGAINNLFTVNSLQDVVRHFQVNPSPTQCDTLKQLLEDARQPETLRTMMNPETPGDAETEFANQFFGALSRGRHMRPPDADLFQGSTAVFLLQGGDRFAIVHNADGDEDADFRLAQQLSMQEEVVPPAPAAREGQKRRRTTPGTWQSVLKEAEPLAPGCAACITCHSFRASICFDCGHQVMCDNCVREMCELPGVRVACPICRCESDGILRPVTSAIDILPGEAGGDVKTPTQRKK